MTTAGTLDNMEPGHPRQWGHQRTPTWSRGIAAGSGHVSPHQALDPGLVYDADESVDFLCALNYTVSQMRLFVHARVRQKHGMLPGNHNYTLFVFVMLFDNSTDVDHMCYKSNLYFLLRGKAI
jgi:hypothetical protein